MKLKSSQRVTAKEIRSAQKIRLRKARRKPLMKVKIYAPTEKIADEEIKKLTAEGIHGSFTLLPKHIDVGVPLPSGILSYISKDDEERIFALDEGILVKQGEGIFISAMKVIKGTSLETLREEMNEKIIEMSDREKKSRSALALLEGSILREISRYGDMINE
ncbi:MAG: F0F1 ATP synthase subunit epsilon [candidate division Zixibacteria bacterium]|nr:F0F1 ATP synthase subunit epsilon [candidate division Zixibacteria bacterium]